MISEGSKLHSDHVVRSAYPYPNDSTAYADGDLIGTKMTFENAVPNEYGGGRIRNVTIIDKDGNAKKMELFIFDQDLGNTGTGKTNWATGNNAALSIGDSDAENIVGVINLSTGDYIAATGAGVTTVNVDLPFYAKSRNLYGLLQSGADPQFNSTGTVVVRLGIERD